MDLREEDLGSALGMEHKLHRRKLLLAREKLRPLSEYEQQKKDIVRIEEKSDRKRKEKSQPNYTDGHKERSMSYQPGEILILFPFQLSLRDHVGM